MCDTRRHSGTEGYWNKNKNEKWTDALKFCGHFCVKEAKKKENEKVARTREEGARAQRGAVLSSFASTAETNEQKKVKTVVPSDVPHDTGSVLKTS